MPAIARRPSHHDELPVDRMRAASAKAREAFAAVARQAKSLGEEIDEATAPAVMVEIHDEDSAVHVVHDMLTSLAAKP